MKEYKRTNTPLWMNMLLPFNKKTILFLLLMMFGCYSMAASRTNCEIHTLYPDSVLCKNKDLVTYPATGLLLSDKSKTNNQAKPGLFFLRAELGPISSLSVGFGGVGAQAFINAGFGLVRDEDNTYHLGFRKRVAIGGRVGIGFSDIFIWNLGARYGFLDVDDWKAQEFTVDLSLTFKNWDVLLGFAIAGPINSEVPNSFNPELTYLTPLIGVGYTFRSKKYWNYRLRKEQDYIEKYAPPEPQQYTPREPKPRKEEPCPVHDKTGFYYVREIQKRIDVENDGIVGIYESVGQDNLTLGVIKNGDSYVVIYMSGGTDDCWEFGHKKAELRPSATPGLFKGIWWYGRNFYEKSDYVFAFDGVTMKMVSSDGNQMFLKMYPAQGESQNIAATPQKWSGTGWAIGNRYIVTNNHVAEGANTIEIKGVGGNINIGYTAVVVATDKVNDIAILEITDSRFKGFDSLPYGVASRIADVGEDVFVVGYPLGQELGEEIKVTTGSINSRTGFGDFQNCYQIQAPITHGNSGGPMFDNKGNVIGIVVGGLNKELNLAENVGYAIKISYLKILIENAGLNISLPSSGSISTLSRPEKVKRVKNYVFFIECSK